MNSFFHLDFLSLSLLRLFCIYTDLFAPVPPAHPLEGDLTFDGSKEGMISADAYIVTGMELRAALMCH
jgi:hypothetical protein